MSWLVSRTNKIWNYSVKIAKFQLRINIARVYVKRVQKNTKQYAKTPDSCFIFCFRLLSGMKKAHKHRQMCPVTAWVRMGSPDRVTRGQVFMCCVRKPRHINNFVRVPGREDQWRGDRENVYVPNACLFPLSIFWVFQRPLTLILLQKCRDINGSRIVIQIGGVYTTFCREEGILLQKYRDRNGRCIAILFKSIGVRGRFDSP